MQREFRIHRLPSAGLLGAPVLGAVFALSWTPCIGPTLGTVLTLAVTDGGAGRPGTAELEAAARVAARQGPDADLEGRGSSDPALLRDR